MPREDASALKHLLNQQVGVATEEAVALGHRLRPWQAQGRPGLQGILSRTRCERCGRPLRVTVTPAGEFIDHTIRRTRWLDHRVPCRR